MTDTAPTYKLDLFEGPLDLLLSLVEKNKIDINDIPIAVLCDQYMEYIGAAENADMDLSADFLVMASTLMLIKSRMLLPRDPETEEDPRTALAAAMLEYKRAKEAAASLAQLYALYGDRIAKEPDELSPDPGYVAEHDVSLLAAALTRVMREVKITTADTREKIEPILHAKTYSVTGKIYSLLVRLRKKGPMQLLPYLREAGSKAELIAMFMGVLELLRAQRVVLRRVPDEDSGLIAVTSDVELELVAGDSRVRTARDDEAVQVQIGGVKSGL